MKKYLPLLVIPILLIASVALAENYSAINAYKQVIVFAATLYNGVLHPKQVSEGLVGGVGNPQPMNVDSIGNVKTIDTAAEASLSTLITSSASIAASATSIATSSATIATNTSNTSPVPVILGTTQGSSVAINTASAATSQLVAASTGKSIFVTAFNFMGAGTTNVTLEYGTGSNCATGTTVLTGAYPLVAQAKIEMSGGNAPLLVVPASNALCIVNSAAIQVSGSTAYVQQ